MNNEMTNGMVFEKAMCILGLYVKLVDERISPQVATYYYDFIDIKQYTKRKLEMVIDKMSHYYHRKFEIVESDISHFAISKPLQQKQTLWLGELTQPSDINSINIGKDLANDDVILDFNKLSHLLIAGTTGSGKSVLMDTIISSLYMNMGGDHFELYIIDPKRTEFKVFGKLPNCLYVDETTNAIELLNRLVYVMEDRYCQMSNNPNVELKHIFVVVDELADLMLNSRYDIEETIVKLAQKSRAVKIHLILATQRPTVNVITGLIKANMPNRICLKMASQIDSRVMLDHNGAEKLLGFGDALIRLDTSTNEKRFQCAMISKANIERCINDLIAKLPKREEHIKVDSHKVKKVSNDKEDLDMYRSDDEDEEVAEYYGG